ncbi:MAG: hypothetical protein KC474_09705, partial [Cyanobacteria bacterium HKST-UBA04]|nr:hypothetical protein [Cyanobacteria bacterium HKST-UBA04]
NMFYTQYVKTGREQGHLDRRLEGMLGFLRNFMARSHTLQNPADLPFANQGVIRLVHGHTPETRLSPFYVTQRSRQYQVNYEVVSLDQTIRKTTDPLTQQGEASLLYVDG